MKRVRKRRAAKAAAGEDSIAAVVDAAVMAEAAAAEDAAAIEIAGTVAVTADATGRNTPFARAGFPKFQLMRKNEESRILALKAWSGRRESNPHFKLGKLAFCH